MSQVERLHDVLIDWQWHSTVELLDRVYGLDHSGIARISARVLDLKRKLPANLTIESRQDKQHPTVWFYRICPAKPIEPPRMDLFQGMTGEAV
jgi:hypothetical protein